MTRPVCCLAAATLLAVAGPAFAQSPAFARADFPTVGTPRTIATADFNKDGWPDLALAGTGGDAVGILLNRGRAGGFLRSPDISVGGGPFDIVVADVNRDGAADIAIANADLNTLTLLLGRGDGTFFPKRDHAVPGNPRGIAVADVDRDGLLDYVVTRYEADMLQVMYGDGLGGYRSIAAFPTLDKPQGVVAGDFNHEGDVELAVAIVSGWVSVYSIRRDGTYDRDDLAAPNASYNVLTSGDFNHDGWADLAAASSSNQIVALFRGGTNGFAYYAAALTTWSPRGIEAADVNQDGWVDLVTGDRVSNNVTVLVGRPDGSGLFAPRHFRAGSGSRDVALADFDRNGLIDVATANEYSSTATVLTNTTALVAPAFAFDRQPLPGVPDYALVLAVSDFNRNGKPDLVLRNATIMDGTTPLYMFGPSVEAVAVGDFNDDGHPDVAVSDGPGIRTYLSDRADGFVRGGGTGPVSRYNVSFLRTGDVNRDGRLDVVASFTSYDVGGQIVVLTGGGDGTFQIGWTWSGASVYDLELADVNRDGAPDIVVSAGQGIHTYLNDGTGHFSHGTSVGFDGEVRDVAVGDLTGDGIPDLALISPTDDHYVEIYDGGHAGGFSLFGVFPATTMRFPTPNAGHLTIADLDNDGHLDVLTYGGALLRNEGDGNLRAAAEFAFHAVMVVDYNSDGMLDVLGLPLYEPDAIVALNKRTTVNHPPVAVVQPGSEATVDGNGTLYHNYAQFWEDGDEWTIDGWHSYDPDMHALDYEWRTDGGLEFGYGVNGYPRGVPSGAYTVILTVRDLRGGEDSASIPLIITPHTEVMMYSRYGRMHGAWREIEDGTAAFDYRMWHPNGGAAKVTTAIANPVHYVDFSFIADPTQQYKLWVRLKAENNYWGNDSVWVQVSGATDVSGNPVYAPGTTSALPVNLEECSGCGVAGWGWEDDGWGAVNRNGTTLRFPAGGPQRLRIQTREDGVSVDQILLSSRDYRSTRPGTAKNDATILLIFNPWIGWWWEP